MMIYSIFKLEIVQEIITGIVCIREKYKQSLNLLHSVQQKIQMNCIVGDNINNSMNSLYTIKSFKRGLSLSLVFLKERYP